MDVQGKEGEGENGLLPFGEFGSTATATFPSVSLFHSTFQFFHCLWLTPNSQPCKSSSTTIKIFEKH